MPLILLECLNRSSWDFVYTYIYIVPLEAIWRGYIPLIWSTNTSSSQAVEVISLVLPEYRNQSSCNLVRTFRHVKPSQPCTSSISPFYNNNTVASKIVLLCLLNPPTYESFSSLKIAVKEKQATFSSRSILLSSSPVSAPVLVRTDKPILLRLKFNKTPLQQTQLKSVAWTCGEVLQRLVLWGEDRLSHTDCTAEKQTQLVVPNCFTNCKFCTIFLGLKIKCR
jgi:hypothetical protein